jgi:ubiquitin C-terminal hydrolase
MEHLKYHLRPVGDYEKTKYLVSVCQACSPQFSVDEQHDSHKFLVNLLDKRHEDLNRVKNISGCSVIVTCSRDA